MSASWWLIMAVRTCNPFQWETNAATVLSFAKAPRAQGHKPARLVTIPEPQEEAPRGARMCGHTVICSKHDGMNKNSGFQQNCGILHWLSTSFLYLTVNSWGFWRSFRSDWLNITEAAIFFKASFLAAGSSFWNRRRDVKGLANGVRACDRISDDRGVFLSDWYRSSLLAAALVSELHVTLLHGGKQLI